MLFTRKTFGFFAGLCCACFSYATDFKPPTQNYIEKIVPPTTEDFQKGIYSVREIMDSGNKVYRVEVNFTETLSKLKSSDRLRAVLDLATLIAEEIRKQQFEIIMHGFDNTRMNAIITFKYGAGNFDLPKMEIALKGYSQADLDATLGKIVGAQKAKQEAEAKVRQEKENEKTFYQCIEDGLALTYVDQITRGPLSDKERAEMIAIRDAIKKIGYLNLTPVERSLAYTVTDQFRWQGDMFTDPGTDELRFSMGYEKNIKRHAELKAVLEKKLKEP